MKRYHNKIVFYLRVYLKSRSSFCAHHVHFIYIGEYALQIILILAVGGACDVMVIVVGNGDGDSSSNPGREWLHFT